MGEVGSEPHEGVVRQDASQELFLSPVPPNLKGFLLVADCLLLEAQGLALTRAGLREPLYDGFHEVRAELDFFEPCSDLVFQVRDLDVLAPVAVLAPGRAMVVGLVLPYVDFRRVAVTAAVAKDKPPEQEVMLAASAGAQIVGRDDIQDPFVLGEGDHRLVAPYASLSVPDHDPSVEGVP